MKIVAFLQNQWFKNPIMARRIYAQAKRPRHELNAEFLFMGCKTGRMLSKAFGDLCDDIIWENASPEIGGRSSSSFKPDPKHMAAVAHEHRPDIVLLFGKAAQRGWEQGTHLRSTPIPRNVFSMPHPTARSSDVPRNLRVVAVELRAITQEQFHAQPL